MRFSAGFWPTSSPMRNMVRTAPLAGNVHARGHLREIPGQVDAANETRGGAGDASEAAAVGERPFAEDVHVTGLVLHLRQEDVARFEEVRRDVGDPAGGHVAGYELDLIEESAKRALRLLEIVGQGRDGLPRDVGGRTPLSLQGFFVQERGVVEPDFLLGSNGIAPYAEGFGPFGRAPRPSGHVVALFRQFAVPADADVFQGQAALAGLGGGSPLAHPLHPGGIEIQVGRIVHAHIPALVRRRNIHHIGGPKTPKMRVGQRPSACRSSGCSGTSGSGEGIADRSSRV